MACEAENGENGENVASIGEETGTIVDESGGDRGRREGGGVAERRRSGVPASDEGGDEAGEGSRGENWPFCGSEVPGEPADTGLVSTSRNNEERKVGSSTGRCTAALDGSPT